MVGSAGLEPANPEGRKFTVSSNCRYANYPMVQNDRIELSSPVWKTGVLPLNEFCKKIAEAGFEPARHKGGWL
jgi:hypothetical protein